MFQELIIIKIKIKQMNLKTGYYCPWQTGNQSVTQAHLTVGFKLKLTLLGRKKTLYQTISNTLRSENMFKLQRKR